MNITEQRLACIFADCRCNIFMVNAYHTSYDDITRGLTYFKAHTLNIIDINRCQIYNIYIYINRMKNNCMQIVFKHDTEIDIHFLFDERCRLEIVNNTCGHNVVDHRRK